MDALQPQGPAANPKYCFVVTNGSNNPNRAIWSLAVADKLEYVELQGGNVLGKILQESIAVWM